MYILMLNLCVIACQYLTPDPFEVQFQRRFIDENFAKAQEGIDWRRNLLVNSTCNYCYQRWTQVYVQNASSYSNLLLFTRESGENYTEVFLNDTEGLLEAGFKPSRNTKILIHGFHNDGYNDFAGKVREAYLAAEDCNVISVNWSTLSYQFYTLAVSAVRPLGKYVAQLVDVLVTDLGVPQDSIHVLGHSLGAHVAGCAGQDVTSGRLTRITGLDPAGPLVPPYPEGRLDPSDAEFVDVIHTCAGLLGYAYPLGHVDFYPNGGTFPQPGCPFGDFTSAHGRSWVYFAESITSKGFIGTSCDSWRHYKQGDCAANNQTVMGELGDPDVRGVYYLRTHSASPFASWNNSSAALFTIHS